MVALRLGSPVLQARGCPSDGWFLSRLAHDLWLKRRTAEADTSKLDKLVECLVTGIIHVGYGTKLPNGNGLSASLLPPSYGGESR